MRIRAIKMEGENGYVVAEGEVIDLRDDAAQALIDKGEAELEDAPAKSSPKKGK